MKINLIQPALVRTFCLFGCLFLFGQMTLRAQTATGWTGTSSGYWNTAGNWSNGIPYIGTGGSSVRIVNFGPPGNAQPNSTNDVSSSLHLFQVFFNTGATNYTLSLKPGAVAYTLFDFSGNAPKFENDSTNLQTIDTTFTLSGNTGGGGAEIDPSQGDIFLTTNAIVNLLTNTQLRFFSSAGHVVTFNAPIIGGTTNSCALMGTATAGAKGTFVIFENTNSCTNIFINAGTVRLATNNVSVNPITVGDTNTTTTSPAALQMDNGLINGSAFVVRSGSTNSRTVGNTVFGSGTADFTGAISLGTNLTTLANATGTLEFDGNIDFQNPSGTGPRNLMISGSGNTLFTGSFTNATTGSSVLTKTNAGTLTIAGTNNGVRILFNLGGGIISITNAADIGVPVGVNYPDKFNFTASATLSVTNSFTLGRNASSVDNAGFRIAGGSTGTFDVAANSILTIDGPIIDLPGSGSGSLAKTSVGKLLLQQTNTYTGNTTISTGALALSGNGSISNSTNIIIASGATFDVSALSSAFTLAASQTLSNSAAGAIINGTNNTVSGTLSLVYDGANPSFIITNGGMTLSAGTVFKVNNTGATLVPGSYKIISNQTGGLVAGVVSGSVTVINGPSAGTPSLSIMGGELYLNVGGSSTVSYTAMGPFTYNGSAQSPTITITGSTGATTTNYVGVAPTSYGPSVNAPANAGTYYVTNTVLSDANNLGTTNSQPFTINQATPTATLAVNNSPQAYTGAAQSATVSVTASSTPGAVANILTGGAATQTGAGIYAVTADYVPADTANYATLTGLSAGNYVINQALTTVTLTGTSFTYDGSPKSPTISISGSTGTITTNYAGIGATAYSDSSAPTAAGTYNLTVAVLSDANYVGATNSLNFTNTTTSVTLNLISSAQTNGYLDSVSFTATNLPVDAGSNVVFTANGVAFSTNDVLNGGTTSLAINNLPRGDTNNIIATYNGDGTYPSAYTNLIQTVTNHPPVVTGDLTVTRNAGMAYHISVTNILAQVSDQDGDPISLTDYSVTFTNGLTLSSNANYLTYPTNAANVGDRFSYTVSDGYDSATGYVNVNILNGFQTGQPITGQQSTNSPTGAFTVTYNGVIGYTYVVQRSTDLTSWLNIATNTIGDSGFTNVVDDFSDLGFVAPSSAYYRVAWKQ